MPVINNIYYVRRILALCEHFVNVQTFVSHVSVPSNHQTLVISGQYCSGCTVGNVGDFALTFLDEMPCVQQIDCIKKPR